MAAAKLFHFRTWGDVGIVEFLGSMNQIRKEDNAARDAKPLWVPEAQPPLTPDLVRNLKEATSLVRFSTAAYSGIALDLARHKKSFLFFYFRRQEVFRTLLGFPGNTVPEQPEVPGSPLSPPGSTEGGGGGGEGRSTSPRTREAGAAKVVKGDNRFGGNAKAFCRYAHVPLSSLRGGRVGHRTVRPENLSMASGLLAYFMCRVPETQSVVVSIRGTADLHDIMVDLCAYEGAVTAKDLGIGADDHKRMGWAHFGILNAVRELAVELGGPTGSAGPLGDLLGPGGECEGWSLRIVGQSLGAAVAGLLALRFRRQYLDVRGICYNPIAVLDLQAILAVGEKTCQNHVLMVVYGNDVISRVTFPGVVGITDRVEDLIARKRARTRQGWRDCHLLCPPCLKQFGWIWQMAQLGLSYVCFCLRHVSDDVYSTVTHAGRAVFAPNYPHHGHGSGRGAARSGVRPFGLVSSQSLPVLAADGKDLVSPSAFPVRALEVEISPRGGQDLAKVGSGLKVLSRKMSGYSFKRGRSRRDGGSRSGPPSPSGSEAYDEEAGSPPGGVEYRAPSAGAMAMHRKTRLSVNSSSMLELSSGVDSAVHASGATLETIHTGRDLESVLERPGTGTTRDSTSGQSARMQFSGPQFRLFGEIVHVEPGRDQAGAKRWTIRRAEPEDFFRMSLADDFLVDHLPWHLEAGLGWICKTRIDEPAFEREILLTMSPR